MDSKNKMAFLSLSSNSEVEMIDHDTFTGEESCDDLQLRIEAIRKNIGELKIEIYKIETDFKDYLKENNIKGKLNEYISINGKVIYCDNRIIFPEDYSIFVTKIKERKTIQDKYTEMFNKLGVYEGELIRKSLYI